MKVCIGGFPLAALSLVGPLNIVLPHIFIQIDLQDLQALIYLFAESDPIELV